MIGFAALILTVSFLVWACSVAQDTGHKYGESGSRAAAAVNTNNILNFHTYSGETKAIDPFGDELGLVPPYHEHVPYGNLAFRQNVSAATLVANAEGSNNGPSFATNLAWRPEVEDGNGPLKNTRAKFYYRLGIGTPANITHIPVNAKMLGTDEFFSCGQGTPDSETPPYGCNEGVNIKILFPQCYNESGGNTPSSYTYPGGDNKCPAGDRIIPELTFNQIYSTSGGANLASPLKVSAGNGEFRDYTFLHADEWATYQRDSFKTFMEDCVFKPLSATLPSKCEPAGNENL